MILASDVVYHPRHAMWIKACVEKLLLHPEPLRGIKGGTFWLVIALRPTGRHAGLSDTVDEIFPDAAASGCPSLEGGCMSGGGEWSLAVLEKEELSKREGIGRADESGYKLFKIGWVRS